MTFLAEIVPQDKKDETPTENDKDDEGERRVALSELAWLSPCRH